MSEQGSGESHSHPIWELDEQEGSDMKKYEAAKRNAFTEKTKERGAVEVWLRGMMAAVEPDIRKLNATPLTQFVITTGRVGDYILATRLYTYLPTEFELNSKKK